MQTRLVKLAAHNQKDPWYRSPSHVRVKLETKWHHTQQRVFNLLLVESEKERQKLKRNTSNLHMQLDLLYIASARQTLIISTANKFSLVYPF